MKTIFKIIKKIIIIQVISTILIFQTTCRNTELKGNQEGKSFLFSLFMQLMADGKLGSNSTSSSSSKPVLFRASGGNLYILGESDTVFESTDGTNFSSKKFTLPDCTSSSSITCEIIAISKSGSTVYALGAKQTTSGGSVTGTTFYYASGTSLATLSFQAISDSNFTSSSNNWGVTRSAASSNGFIVYFQKDSNTNLLCGKTSSGWTCVTNPYGSNNFGGFVENLNGTLLHDIYYRWNGTSFTATGASNAGYYPSAIYSSGRTLQGSLSGTIRYTTTDPSVWPASLSTTNSALSSNGNENVYLLGVLSSGVLPAILGTNSNTSLKRYSSSDNGTSWTSNGNVTLPSNTGIQTNLFIPEPPITLYNGVYYISMMGNDSSNAYIKKFYKTTDFSTWTEIILQ